MNIIGAVCPSANSCSFWRCFKMCEKDNYISTDHISNSVRKNWYSWQYSAPAIHNWKLITTYSIEHSVPYLVKSTFLLFTLRRFYTNRACWKCCTKSECWRWIEKRPCSIVTHTQHGLSRTSISNPGFSVCFYLCTNFPVSWNIPLETPQISLDTTKKGSRERIWAEIVWTKYVFYVFHMSWGHCINNWIRK